MNKMFVFIFNADSSPFAYLVDGVKKVAGKGTCSLCNATYGWVSKKSAWKQFEKDSGITAVYQHRDDMPADMSAYIKKEGVRLPVVLQQKKDGYAVAVSADELDDCSGSEDCLIEKMKKVVG